jgi:hypothetical protein
MSRQHFFGRAPTKDIASVRERSDLDPTQVAA